MTNGYLIDTCIVIELLRGEESTKKWLEDLNSKNESIVVGIAGWTILELLKEQKSKTEMETCLKKLSSYKAYWNKPEFSDDVPSILTNHFHDQRTNGKLNGQAIYDVLIYTTAKSNNMSLVTRDGKDFAFSKDVEIVDLCKIENGKYKLS